MRRVNPYPTMKSSERSINKMADQIITGRKRKIKMADLCTRDKRRRLKTDGLLNASGECKFSREELMEMLRAVCDVDGKWILRKWQKLGKMMVSLPKIAQKLP